ncbi:MAG TPA: ABC transporter ATP-binding protein [Actinomycetota bacterium]
MASLTDPNALLTGRGPELGQTVAPAIQLSGVTRVFGAMPALVRVDLRVERGETILVRGPNGAGKTTLLRVIATAISPTFGSGAVLGFDLLTGREEIRRRVELVGHRTRLYEDLSGRENLRFFCTVFGLRASSIPEILGRIGLEDAADERVRGYSQGMRQRVVLGRVLLRRPDLLLLDEPYAGLDAEAKDLVDQAVLEAQRECRTVVVATHDPTRGGMASRIVHMDVGRVLSHVQRAPSSVAGVVAT